MSMYMHHDHMCTLLASWTYISRGDLNNKSDAGTTHWRVAIEVRGKNLGALDTCTHLTTHTFLLRSEQHEHF